VTSALKRARPTLAAHRESEAAAASSARTTAEEQRKGCSGEDRFHLWAGTLLIIVSCAGTNALEGRFGVDEILKLRQRVR
jgi:hypothetical protein